MLHSRTCLGVDISGGDVRIVELRESGSRYEVVQAAALRCGNWDPAGVLKRFLLETDTTPSCAVFSLPTGACSVKFAGLPRANATETARMARYEAENRIPVPLSEVIWGYSAGRSVNEEGLRDVVLAAARRTDIESLLARVEPSGIPASAVTVAALAQVRGLLRSMRDRSESVLIIDIGNELTDLTVVTRGQVTACHSLPLGLNGLVEAVAADRGIDAEAARELLPGRSVLQGLHGVDSVDDLQARQWLASLALEARRAALSGSQGGGALSRVLLTGQGAAFPELMEAISGQTGLSVEAADPWEGMALSRVAAHGETEHSALFATATGLAVSGLDRRDSINLLPAERAEEESRRRKQIATLGGLGLAALILFLLLAAGRPALRAREAESQRIREQITAARKARNGGGADLARAADTVEKAVNALQGTNRVPLDVIRGITMSLSASCWLSELRFEAGRIVVLRGSALSNSAVADTVYKLAGGETFEAVSLDYSNLKGIGGDEVYDFQVKCTLPPRKSVSSKPEGAKKPGKGLVVR